MIIDRLHRSFPAYGDSNVFWFYVVTFLSASWFQIGNWFLFVLLFMSAQDFAIAESVAFGLGLLLEIPSGAIADLLGRKRTVAAGLFLQSLGSFLFLLADVSVAILVIGNTIIIASFALRSGSLEALVYDSLKEKKLEKHYDDVIGKSLGLNIAGNVIAALIGGFLWTVSVYLPWALTAIIFVFGFLATLKLHEPSIDSEKFSLQSFIKQSKQGFYYLFKSSFKKYTYPLAILAGTFLAWEAGIIRVVMGEEFGYDGQTINYLISATMLVSFFAVHWFSKLRKKAGDTIGYSSILLMSALSWLIAGLTDSLVLGALVFAMMSLSGSLSDAWNSVILNEHVHSKNRATAISTLQFLVQLPYVLVVIYFGSLIAADNTSLYYVGSALLLLIAVGVFINAEKSDS